MRLLVAVKEPIFSVVKVGTKAILVNEIALFFPVLLSMGIGLRS